MSNLKRTQSFAPALLQSTPPTSEDQGTQGAVHSRPFLHGYLQANDKSLLARLNHIPLYLVDIPKSEKSHMYRTQTDFSVPVGSRTMHRQLQLQIVEIYLSTISREGKRASLLKKNPIFSSSFGSFAAIRMPEASDYETYLALSLLQTSDDCV